MTIQELVNVYNKKVRNADVVNIANHPPVIKLPSYIGCYGIRKAQNLEFKNPRQKYGAFEINPNDDTHSMMHFNKETLIKAIIESPMILEEDKEKIKKIWEKENWAKVFSVEPPKATLIPIESFLKDEISVYRYTMEDLNEEDYKILAQASLPIIGTKYDYWQLINIAVCQELGYSFKEKVSWFNQNKRNMVCSVGVASIFQKRKYVKEKQGILVPRLFSNLNESMWSEDFVKRFKENGSRWSIETTYPCMFGLTRTHFAGEFRLILAIKNKEIVYEE